MSRQHSMVSADVSLPIPPTGAGTLIALVGRHVSPNDYRAKMQWPAAGPVTLAISRVVGGAEITLAPRAISALVPIGSDTVTARFQLTGSGVTTLNAKVWKTGTPEPAAWPVSKTDTAVLLQGPAGGARGPISPPTHTPAR